MLSLQHKTEYGYRYEAKNSLSQINISLDANGVIIFGRLFKENFALNEILPWLFSGCRM